MPFDGKLFLKKKRPVLCTGPFNIKYLEYAISPLYLQLVHK